MLEIDKKEVLSKISPYPWRVITDNEIEDASGANIIVTDSGFYPPSDADANIMSAAPELLSSVIDLYELVEKYISFPERYVASNNDKSMKLIRAKEAIEKAIGANNEKRKV